jgi:protein-S-isoprenylcysteine O-methyltransferase Ste14
MGLVQEGKRNWRAARGRLLTQLGFLFLLLQIFWCFRFYNWLGWTWLTGMGWALLVFALLVAWRARVTLESTEGSNLDLGTALVDRGIYGLVRHPMYLAFALISLALVLISGHWLAPFLALFPLLAIRDVIQDEEDANQRRFGAAYDRYRSSVPGTNLAVGLLRRWRG